MVAPIPMRERLVTRTGLGARGAIDITGDKSP